jgi:CubicO group peptidase (beta-lactamase class C family)
MSDAPDRVRFVLEQPLVRPPGAAWIYNGGTTALIAETITRRAGRPLDDLAKELLFDPLGIGGADWVRYGDGTPVAASGLRLRPRDLARIGETVLRRGRWQGRQVVPADWVAAATAPRINGQGLFFYGLQWWLGRSLVRGEEVTWAAGVGWGGQRLFVVPARDLVVVVHAGLYDNPMMQPIPAEVVLRRYALAACR